MPDFNRDPVNLHAEALVFPLCLIESLRKDGERGMLQFFSAKASGDKEWGNLVQEKASCHANNVANKKIRYAAWHSGLHL